jgi:FkbM family methyltransferase
MRSTFHKLLRRSGYDIHRTSRWGSDLMFDLHRVLGPHVSTIVDVGANRGQSALAFMDAFGQACVYSFEPQAIALAQLNCLAAKSPRLKVFPFALGSNPATVPLNIAASDDGSSLLDFQTPGRHPWTTPAGTVSVEVRRLDEVARSLSLERIDLLKIDTQGFDLEVLRGAGELLRTGPIRAILIELNFDSYYSGQAQASEIFGHLAERGYRPVGLYSGSRQVSGQLDWADGLFA